jgi:hypothetical protein
MLNHHCFVNWDKTITLATSPPNTALAEAPSLVVISTHYYELPKYYK